MSAQWVKTLGCAIDFAGRGFYESAFSKLDQCDLSETQHGQIKAILANLSLIGNRIHYSYGDDYIGVAPGVPAEVPRPPTLGAWELDKGH